MLNESLVERALLWLANERGEAPIQAARRAFESASGAIEEGAADYEARIAHFLEHYLCSGPDAPLAAFARAGQDLPEAERRELAGWLRSYRSLFEFAGLDGEVGRVHDRIRGGQFLIAVSDRDRQLAVGELFDGRLVALHERLWLSPGRVYHPHEAHDALRTLLGQLDIDMLAHEQVLDGLLAMRSRFLTFESVRAEHVYQARALAPVHLPVRTG